MDRRVQDYPDGRTSLEEGTLALVELMIPSQLCSESETSQTNPGIQVQATIASNTFPVSKAVAEARTVCAIRHNNPAVVRLLFFSLSMWRVD